MKGTLVVSQIWVIVYGGKYSFHGRIISTYIFQGLALLAIPFLVLVGPNFGFYSTFILLILFGLFGGVCQCSIFSMSGGLPSKNTAALMLGPGICGCVTIGLRFIVLALYPSRDFASLWKGAFFSYAFAAGFLFLCAFLQWRLGKNEYALYHLKKFPGFKPEGGDNHDEVRLSVCQEKEVTVRAVLENIRENFNNTRGLLYAIAGCFFFTMIIFPGWTNDSYFNFLANTVRPESWYQVTCVTIFSFVECPGAYIANTKWGAISLETAKSTSYYRVIFIVTFVLVAFECPPVWLFGADWFKVTNFCIFAFTLGYHSTMCAKYVPGVVHPTKRAQATAYISICISVGILLGTFGEALSTPLLNLTPKIKNGGKH